MNAVAVAFDTLKAATRLQDEAGFSEQQAHGLVNTFAEEPVGLGSGSRRRDAGAVAKVDSGCMQPLLSQIVGWCQPAPETGPRRSSVD